MKNKYSLLLLLSLLLFLQQITIAQNPYQHDRVYTANQVSNTVSVIDPSTQTLLGEIVLGKPQPDILTALYKGQALVHGLRYNPQTKMLAVVSIGSNGVTFISTENNKVIKTVYVGRSPHEPTFSPNGKQVWISVRGEAYLSVIDVAPNDGDKKGTRCRWTRHGSFYTGWKVCLCVFQLYTRGRCSEYSYLQSSKKNTGDKSVLSQYILQCRWKMDGHYT